MIGAGIGFATGAHGLAADAAVLLGTMLLGPALFAAFALVAVGRSGRRAASRRV